MGERYRHKARELLARAEVETSSLLKIEFEELVGLICAWLSRRSAMMRSLLSSSCPARRRGNFDEHRPGGSTGLSFIEMDSPPPSPVEPLILCSICKLEMRLLGIEPETDIRDLFTF